VIVLGLISNKNIKGHALKYTIKNSVVMEPGCAGQTTQTETITQLDRPMRNKTTAEDKAAITDQNAGKDKRIRAMGHISFDKLEEYEPVLVQLTKDVDPLIKGYAFRLLLGSWCRTDLFQEALELMLDKSEELTLPRSEISTGFHVWSLGITDRKSPLLHKVISGIVKAIIDEPDIVCKEIMYGDAISMITNNEKFILPRKFKFDTDADWETLNSYLD